MRDIVAGIGGIPFLILGLIVGVVLLHRRPTERWGRRWLTVLAIAYWLMSTTAFPALFGGFLTRPFQPLTPGPQLEGVSFVVVLSGGSDTVQGHDGRAGVLGTVTLARVLEGVRVFHMLRDARVVASGSAPPNESHLIPEAEIMRSTLISLGVPADRVILETAGRNTREQAINTAAIVRQHGTDRCVLVTTPIHMRRAAGTFRAAGITPVPAISTPGIFEATGIGYFLPDANALDMSQQVLHEYIGLSYYLARGWAR